MSYKLLYIIGGHFEHAKYLGMNSEEGDIRKLINKLKQLRKTYDEIALLLDVNQTSKFPLDNSDFWDFFKATSSNSVLFILHKRNEEIEKCILEMRSSHSISGPIYYKYHLQDGTPVSDIEREIILHSLYKIYPDNRELEGVLSLRIFMPSETVKLPNKIEKLYQEKVNTRIEPNDMNIDIVESDLDTTKFSSILTISPFDNIDIQNDEDLQIPEGYLGRVLDTNFNEDRYSQVQSQLKILKNEVFDKKIENIDTEIAVTGSSKLINFYSTISEKIKKRLDQLKNNIKNKIRIIDQCKQKTSEDLKSIIGKHKEIINQDLKEFQQKYATFSKFLRSEKINFIIFLILGGCLFSLSFLIVRLAFEYSLILSTVLSILLILLRWLQKRKTFMAQFYEICDMASNELKTALHKDFLEVPKLLWERNLYLFNLKLLRIKYIYILLTLHTLKIITENSPINLIDNIFSTKNRMIFFAPSSSGLDDITIDELETYLYMDKSDIDNYYINQFFKNIISLKIGTIDRQVINSINDYYIYPDKGLLWDIKEVEESRRDKYFKTVLYHPLTLDFDIPNNSNVRVDDVKKISYDSSLQSIILLSFFHFKNQEDL